MWKNIAIAGLGFGLLYAIGKSEIEKEEASKEKLHLIAMNVSFARDVLKLQMENSKLKKQLNIVDQE